MYTQRLIVLAKSQELQLIGDVPLLLGVSHDSPLFPLRHLVSLSDWNRLTGLLQENNHSLAPQLMAPWQQMPPFACPIITVLLLRKTH